MRRPFILLMVFAPAWIAACTSRPELGPRFKETQLNSHFRLTGAPFSEYMAHTRRVIGKVRLDLTPENTNKIIEANSPFEWRPDPARCPAGSSGKIRDGILLMHGLTDSPFQMWDIGRHLLAKCFLVRGILLPGHGTVPGDLLGVTYPEWIKAAGYGLDSFKGKVENLYVGGFSTGGALAIYHALYGRKLKGLLLFSPAVKIASNLGFMANWHKVISWKATHLKWMDIAEDEDYAKYESFAFNAADQIYLLTREITAKRNEAKITAPIFAALSENDATVDSEQTIQFFKEQTNPDSVMLLYSNRRVGGDDPRIVKIPARFPRSRVLSLSHLAVHISPENPHYGQQGDYASCLHYLAEKNRMKKCQNDSSEVFYGEVTKENLGRGTLRRVTFNPDFSNLLARLDRFLERTGKASP